MDGGRHVCPWNFVEIFRTSGNNGYPCEAREPFPLASNSTYRLRAIIHFSLYVYILCKKIKHCKVIVDRLENRLIPLIIITSLLGLYFCDLRD